MSSAQVLPAPEKRDRLVSLDVFRGLTIAAMVMVNNPGSWGSMYWPLDHIPWDGWTPTDFIFPFFLFIVGVAMTYSFDKRVTAGASKALLFEQVVRRTIILFFLGLIGYGFPNFRVIMPYILGIAGLEFFFYGGAVLTPAANSQAMTKKIIGVILMIAGAAWFFIDKAHFQGHVIGYDVKYLYPRSNDIEGGRILRIPGVLQRIALCYFFASIIVLFTKVRGRIVWAAGLIIGYWLIMKYVHAPDGYEMKPMPGDDFHIDPPASAPFPGLLNDWIDVNLFGTHIYSDRPDPEGLLSTMTATATTLLGVLTGNLLMSKRTREQKGLLLMITGCVMLLVGICLHAFFPINKKIWSSSFVIFMAGWAMLILSICYAIADVFMERRWVTPFMVFGTNSILIFVGSGILGRMILMIKFQDVALKTWIYKHLIQSWIHDVYLASLAYSLFYILFWLAVTYPLYRKKIFLKV